MRYYISGAMSSRTKEEYTAHFMKAEAVLKAGGCKVFNPVRWGWFLKHFPYRFALAFDLFMMCFCSRVYMLDGWTLSDGSCAEHQFARCIGLVVMYEL